MKIQDFELSANLLAAILWQYESAPKLKAIIKAEDIAHRELSEDFWSQWIRDVFDVDTATAFGLSVWAKILDVDLSLAFDPQPEKIAFGVSLERRNFAPRSNFGARSGSTVRLTNEQARLIIRARYFSLTNQPTLDNINRFLRDYFWKGESKAYVDDLQNMQMLYTFNYQPSGALSFLLNETNILPRPSGVSTGYRIIDRTSWGAGQYRANFNNGNFGKTQ